MRLRMVMLRIVSGSNKLVMLFLHPENDKYLYHGIREMGKNSLQLF